VPKKLSKNKHLLRMNVNKEFFSEIYSQDIIYHYTKASTAIDYILFDKRLKFNSRIKSNDPFEAVISSRGIVFGFNTEIDEQTNKDSNTLCDYMSTLESQYHQICFCKNHIEDDILGFSGNEELFGFTKLRMWEQYADNFYGVCLAFSKEKILSLLNKDQSKIISGDVNYLKFQNIHNKKIGDINGDRLKQIGFDNYKKELDEGANESFFIKHEDFIGENEFRIVKLFDEKECVVENKRGRLIIDETMTLNIADCLKAIFISSFLNDKQKNELLNYANEFCVPIIEMVWKFDSFEAEDYREEKNFQNLIEEIGKK
jgi:hypothetical protein